MKCPPDLKIIQKKVKSKNTNFFCLEESCATQQPYQNNQGTLWWSDDLTENPGLRYFLYRMKKIRKPNKSENRQIAFTCQLHKSRRTKTRQSIKFGKYVCDACIRSKCGYCLSVWMCFSITRISNVCFTNMPDRDESEGACCIFISFICYFIVIFNQGGPK